jgi:hypothetical protein
MFLVKSKKKKDDEVLSAVKDIRDRQNISRMEQMHQDDIDGLYRITMLQRCYIPCFGEKIYFVCNFTFTSARWEVSHRFDVESIAGARFYVDNVK